jgi:iron(III) transport system substrate-binding protein
MEEGAMRHIFWRFAAATTLLAVTAASSAYAQTPPQTGMAVWKYLAGLPAKERLTVLESEARKEGSLVLWGVLGIDRAAILLDGFRQRFPGIDTQFVRLTTDAAPERLMLEQRTNHVTADNIISSTSYLDLHKQALAPYEPTTWASFDPRFRNGSAADGWTAISYEVLPEAIAWRTDRITKDEAPKTLDALADPKWHGRIGTTNQLVRALDMTISVYGEAAAMKRFKALAAQDNRLYKSIASLSEALGGGQIDLAWGIGVYRADQLKRSGAPIDYVFGDPLFALGVTISAIRNSPHPYAAALFMEYLTEARTLEALDKVEPGRMFGNTKGTYAIDFAKYPSLRLYQPITAQRFATLDKIVQDLFIRR